jgi:hypothetical protein
VRESLGTANVTIARWFFQKKIEAGFSAGFLNCHLVRQDGVALFSTREAVLR